MAGNDEAANERDLHTQDDERDYGYREGHG
jgi:hypothetical protein